MLGSFGEVLVVDWGLAVSLAAPTPGSRLRHGVSVENCCGTPAYMPPELETSRLELTLPAGTALGTPLLGERWLCVPIPNGVHVIRRGQSAAD